MTVIANNGTAVQMILPNFMRARGMAVHQMVFFGAMVAGSLLWGKVANLCERAGRADRLAAHTRAAHRARRVDPAAAARRCRAPERNLSTRGCVSSPQVTQKFSTQGRIRL